MAFDPQPIRDLLDQARDAYVGAATAAPAYHQKFEDAISQAEDVVDTTDHALNVVTEAGV